MALSNDDDDDVNNVNDDDVNDNDDKDNDDNNDNVNDDDDNDDDNDDDDVSFPAMPNRNRFDKVFEEESKESEKERDVRKEEGAQTQKKFSLGSPSGVPSKDMYKAKVTDVTKYYGLKVIPYEI